MNIDFKLIKKYWVLLVLIIPYLGLASYAEGLRPVFYFQLQNATCASIIVGYVNAVRAQDQAMINYWKIEAAAYGCRLPPI
jgi:hypothetical protein